MSDLAVFARAADLAARAHVGQRRKGGDVPYVGHVLEVAMLVAEAGGSAEEVTAAVLHDVVEDSDITLDALAEGYGPEVARLVEGCTDDPAWADLPRPERKSRQAAHLPGEPEGVKRIKLADQTSNVRDISRLPEAWPPSDAAEYLEGAERVVAACRGASPALEAAFDAAVAEAMQKSGGTP
ncbi:HD domain-containing protein [Pseudoroseicyclus tamaricis]|uniref:HD domain-containing protein n=1 Tax=Pseudoroseicyclus tamaricis TaxID=2705421 RepID=UPI001F3415EE|nr:HD domain-containing protein [Pseudoroseicyclus tamaricis]